MPVSFQLLDYLLISVATQATVSHEWLRVLTYFCAQLLIVVFPFVLLWLWDRPELASRHHGARKAVMMAIVSIVVALAIKSAFGIVIFRERPFVTHVDLAYLPFRLDPGSFPSGHALVAFSIAASLFFSGYRRIGWALFAAAVLVALGRVFAGVHYPSDVLAGALIGTFSSWYLHREASSIKRYLPNS